MIIDENFIKLVESWKNTRELAILNNDIEAVRMLDIAFTYLIPQREILSYIKKYNDYRPIKEVNGLNIKEAFNLELEIYKRVHHYNNFPKLVSYNEKLFKLEIEHCGQSLNRVGNRSLKIKNLDNQIKNICFVLKKENITHLDLCLSGKNICTKNGLIYLIDFDMAVIDNKPINLKLKKMYENKKNENIYKTIHRILSVKIKND